MTFHERWGACTDSPRYVKAPWVDLDALQSERPVLALERIVRALYLWQCHSDATLCEEAFERACALGDGRGDPWASERANKLARYFSSIGANVAAGENRHD